MTDIGGRSSVLSSAIRYLQDRILTFALTVAFVATASSFWSLGVNSATNRANSAEIDRLSDTVAVYEIYIQKLHADLIAHGFEPPKLPQEKEE